MNETELRLIECFTRVFPDLRADEVASASTDTVPAWDSVAHITLLTAVSEDFGIEFEPEDYVNLISYAQIADAVRARRA